MSVIATFVEEVNIVAEEPTETIVSRTNCRNNRTIAETIVEEPIAETIVEEPIETIVEEQLQKQS